MPKVDALPPQVGDVPGALQPQRSQQFGSAENPRPAHFEPDASLELRVESPHHFESVEWPTVAR